MTTYRLSSMPLRDLSNLTISRDTVRQTDSKAASHTRETQMARGGVWESACSMFASSDSYAKIFWAALISPA